MSNKYKNLRSFNLVEAQSGCPVITRSGIPARIIAYDRYDSLYHGNLIVLLKYKKWERVIAYNDEGHVASALDPTLDLFLYEA